MSLNDTSSVLSFLQSRKSGSAKAMGPPGPNASQIDEILRIAVRVPDHGKLTPWRFVIFEGDARKSIGEVFAGRYKELHPAHGEESLAFQRGLFMRAPVIIGVVSRAVAHPKIPEWEQQMSAAAVAYNIELAAAAMGFHSQWQTDWVAYDRGIAKAMGLSGSERIAGFVYIGTSTAPLEDRPRPDPQSLVTRWSGA